MLVKPMVSSFGFPLNQSNDTKDSVVGTQWGGYNAEVGGYNGDIIGFTGLYYQLN